jgi:hypothetical protein
MYVQVILELSVTPTSAHEKSVRVAASLLTDNENSVHVVMPEDHENVIIAEFTIKKARQMDVVDKIARRFHFVENYEDLAIRFPKMPTYGPAPAKRFTSKQGQYLAFIYYYIKLNGRPPAERDMQNYFQTTPPTVHNMVLELEKRGLIERVPHQPRSIKLLLSRAEIPDLD